MSLIPLLMGDYSRPTKLLDQHFGLAITPEDLLLPPYSPFALSSYYRPWRAHLQSMTQDSGSTVTNDKDTFQVCLDVQQFTPNEITVKTTDRQIVVEGKHEEREDEHGIIFRHFIRKYTLPNQCDAKDVTSSLSSDGVLIISAEKKYLEDENQRVVVINKVGALGQKSEISKSKGTLQPSFEEDIKDSISAKYDKEIRDSISAKFDKDMKDSLSAKFDKDTKDSLSAKFDKDMKDSLSTRFDKDIKDSIITSIKGSSKIEDVKVCSLKSDESVKHALNNKSYSIGLSGADIGTKKDVRLMEKKDFSSSMMSSCGAVTTEEAFESSEMSCQMKQSNQSSSSEIISDTIASELKRAAENV